LIDLLTSVKSIDNKVLNIEGVEFLKKGKLVYEKNFGDFGEKFVKTILVSCNINGRETINTEVLR